MRADARSLFFLAGLLAVAPFVRAEVKTGTYLGNGTGRTITGVGFGPVMVIVKGNDSGSPDEITSAVLKSATMPGGTSKPLKGDQGLLSNLVLSLDGDGFTIGSDRRVNQNGIAYHWVAFSAAPELRLGTYTGNGAGQSVAGVGFHPDYLILMENGASRSLHHSRHFATSFSFAGEASYSGAVTSLDPDGFTVGNSVHVNESSRTYHYVAWKETPGRMRVSWYFGSGADNRSIAVGFSPEYALVKSFYSTDEAVQRFSSMTGDASLNFMNAIQSNRIQAFQTTGFQVGNHNTVNSSGNDYFFVAFGNGASPGLDTLEGAGTLTVTVPEYFDLTFSTSAGGGIESFHDLASGSNDFLDLAGGELAIRSLFFDSMASGGPWYNTGQNDVRSRLDLLEATPTRVKVRQEAFYQIEGGTTLLPGVKGSGDYSVYPSGRIALRWDRRTTKAVLGQLAQMGLGVHFQSTTPLDGWSAWSESAALPTPGGPGSDAFVLAGIHDLTYGTYTDFLQILHRPWSEADATRWFQSPSPAEWGVAVWEEADGQSLPPLQRWDSLLYFKPTDFADNADPRVLERRDDYRAPDALSIPVGWGWNENKADGDFFNESEAAYTLDFDPASGLVVELDGSGTTRHQPFFKIRQWRSLQKPLLVTLEGTALQPDIQYRADVKPLARAHLAPELLWHSSLHSPGDVASPDAGAPGTITGGTAFVSGRYGNGARFTAPADSVRFPAPGSFRTDRGTVELWYLPTYASNDGAPHRIWSYFLDDFNQFLLSKEANGDLTFEILRGGVSTKVTIPATNYGWLDFEWVHLRATWDQSAPLQDQVRIFVNRREPLHVDPTSLYASPMPDTGTVVLGADELSTLSAAGLIDEFRVHGTAGGVLDAAQGGLAANPNEHLGTPARDFVLSLDAIDSLGRGSYLYFGADTRFRGLNVSLSTPGTGGLDLAWEYWNGGGWADLESGTGFADETQHLTRNGSIYWVVDPVGWSEISIDGDVDLFYLRVHVASGAYATSPVEKEIRTDVLLFQYTEDLTAPGQSFAFGVPPAADVSISSSMNQSYPVGAAAPVVAADIAVTDLIGGSITPAGDIRIRIPAGFPIRWDATLASVSLSGSAAVRVLPAIKAFEDLDRTVVLDVVDQAFGPGEQLLLSGLRMVGFTHPAGPDFLELEIDQDGTAAAFDDKTLRVLAGAGPSLSSFDHQRFVEGQPPTPSETLFITESAAGGSITQAGNIGIRIPASFPMQWDTLATGISISGPAASKISSIVSYPASDRVLIEVTSDFAPGEFVAISGLRFQGFATTSPADNLELEAPAGLTAALDDKTIRVDPAAVVPFFTATATSFRVKLEWRNPPYGACDAIWLLRKEGDFPSGPDDVAATLLLQDACNAGAKMEHDDETVDNDVTYFYAIFVEHMGAYTVGRYVKSRPFDTSGPVKWAYSTGATSMAAPGLRFFNGDPYVYAVSNDSILHAVTGGETGGIWPSGFTPHRLGAPAQSRPPVLHFPVGSSSDGAALLGSQDGSVYAVDAASGALAWVRPIASMVQAAPAGNFKGFNRPDALDLVLVGTRNSSGSNALVALDLHTGNLEWGFDNSLPQNGNGLGIGIISSSAAVDYDSKQVYFATRARSGGSTHTLWCVDFASDPPRKVWSIPIGNVDGSPVLWNGVIYVGTNAGEIYAVDATSGSIHWSLPLSDGPVKGFLFPHAASGALFLATNSKLWSVDSGGGTVSFGWPLTSPELPPASTPTVIPGGSSVLVGGTDGHLYQIDRANPLPLAKIAVGDGTAAVGVPTYDLLHGMAYVGTDQGVVYGVLLPLPIP